MFFSFDTKHACDRQPDGQTDRRTDGQNYDPQDPASIAALRGKNARMVTERVQHMADQVQLIATDVTSDNPH